LAQNYVHRRASAVRRQVDADRDVVSLAHLIQNVGRYPHVLSRDRYVQRTAGWQTREETDHRLEERLELAEPSSAA
jgi:hypothetical protein